jgi:hypothetical protein
MSMWSSSIGDYGMTSMEADPPTCRAAWGSGAPIQCCTLPEGHDGLHADGRGEEFDGSGQWPGNPFGTKRKD